MNIVILDLPVPYELIEIDMDKPLEEQLPAGPLLEAVKAFLAHFPEYSRA